MLKTLEVTVVLVEIPILKSQIPKKEVPNSNISCSNWFYSALLHQSSRLKMRLVSTFAGMTNDGIYLEFFAFVVEVAFVFDLVGEEIEKEYHEGQEE